jgi:hypothetical protein
VLGRSAVFIQHVMNVGFRPRASYCTRLGSHWLQKSLPQFTDCNLSALIVHQLSSVEHSKYLQSVSVFIGVYTGIREIFLTSRSLSCPITYNRRFEDSKATGSRESCPTLQRVPSDTQTQICLDHLKQSRPRTGRHLETLPSGARSAQVGHHPKLTITPFALSTRRR